MTAELYVISQGKPMRRDEIDNELKDASFDYFYWFSRFEFSLKENKYLKDHRAGVKAEPSWEEFRKKHRTEYVLSKEASRLKALHPKRQIVSGHGELDWTPVGVSHCKDDLCRVIIMLNAVRNNLFHGGKHGDTEMDSKERNLELLRLGKIVLDQMVQLGGFESDYRRYY
jgi:hypothetical protein